MGRRLFNGNAFSEDGWPYVDQGSCRWVKIAAAAQIQIQDGIPAVVMGAFARDYDAYVEPIYNPDCACWTEGNSVATSNHPGGTAMDLRWESHKFQQRGTFNAAQQATIDELLDWYEGLIWWGGRWESPVDEMHWQMGYDTYDQDNDRPLPKCQDFIDRKIRSDGFSTFRRGDAPPPPLSREDRYALLIIAEGQRRGITPRGIQIALATGLVESNLTIYANAKVPASMDIPHDAVGSDGYSVGIFQQQVRDTGNGWWWGDAATCMDPTSSAGLFYDRLARLDYNGPDSPGSYAQTVQQSAFPDRYDERFADAVDLYSRLAGVTPPPTPGDDLSAEAERQINVIYQEITKKFPSRSPLRHLGEGVVDTMAGFLLNTDSSQHVEIVKLLASLGHPESLALLREVAAADPTQYPDRQSDRLIAQAILADVTTPGPPVKTVVSTTAAPPPQVVYVNNNNPPVVAPSVTTGQIIGNAYDALEALNLSNVLTDAEKAPLAALIGVLQTKNGGATQ